MQNTKQINIIGAGLAGCEAAHQVASCGLKVKLFERRDKDIKSPAHVTDNLAELVCSNSLRSDDINSAVGLLHWEMRQANSLILEAADNNKVPAGEALAVDREGFSNYILDKLQKNPNIEILRQEISEIDDDNHWIIASGPLTSEKLSQQIQKLTGKEHLAFFDAISPIVHKDSINFSKAWFQSRYDKVGPDGDGKDYINCPLNEEQYNNFISAILAAEKTEFKEWEKDTPYFDGCLPIEVMAARGEQTLRFGPMKPVGLTNPHNPSEKPYAIVQLRQDNKLGTLYNIVGFQTKMKYGAQQEIFKQIPGLESAQFARLGGIHRNNFINSPTLLDKKLYLKNNIQFAGQITGVEGYVESAAIGLLCGLFAANQNIQTPPDTSALGALLNHITTGHLDDQKGSFQPMNINFGLFPPLAQRVNKKERKMAYSKRAQDDLNDWLCNIKAK